MCMHDNDTVTNVCHGIMSEDFLWAAKKIGDICKEILTPLNLQKLHIKER